MQCPDLDKKMKQADLGEAYRRAGSTFRGQKQQNFVVLHDSCPPVVTPWVRRQVGADTVGSVARAKMKIAVDGSGSGTPEKRQK